EDVRACAEAGAAGVIAGRALYEGRLDLTEALREFPTARAAAP
ncbi:MAG: 1-(5-phosphoribosyl)-5-((5-phosphoribosylamino)methylideneamino)imidazole-4-carboxamide isomerase, partial [Candidatus Dormibacteria bacterium]